MHSRFKQLLYMGGLLLLAACSTSSPTPINPNPSGNTDPPATTPGPDPYPTEVINGYAVDGYMLMVPMNQNQLADPIATKAAMEKDYAGKVVIWDGGDDPYCLLKVSKPDPNTNPDTKAEPNLRSFVSGGSFKPKGSSIWSNGSSIWSNGSSIWSNGSAWKDGSAFWNGGSYAAVAENNAIWQQIGLEQAFEYAPHLGKGVTVAVIDTGIDLQHFMFKGALVPSSDMYDFVDEDSTPQEAGTLGKGGFGHGTNVAGIIRQVAPNATLMPLRVIDPNGEGNVMAVARAIYWAVSHGAKIINLSLGSAEPVPVVERAIRFATRQGILFSISVGNDGLSSVLYPAYDSCDSCDKANLSAPYRVSVGSVTGGNKVSSFSNRNDITAQVFENRAEIGAPGELVFGPLPGGFKGAWSGTSQAAPVIAGVFALALGEQQSCNLPALESLPALLKETAAPISGGPSLILGNGRVDAGRFLEICKPVQVTR